jgi:hypothetical protein
MDSMHSPAPAASQAAAGRTTKLHLTHRQWHDLLRELARRGAGARESGAFLLAHLSRPQDIVEVAYHDDLDPACLTGGISFAGTGYGRLWSLCRDRGLTVVADIHTHPGTVVRQSRIDATNPMISHPGHVAIIVPDLGHSPDPDLAGVHVYAGGHRWISYLGEGNQSVLSIDCPGRSSARRARRHLRQAITAVRDMLPVRGPQRSSR